MTATVSERFEEVNIQRSEGPTAGSTEPSQLGRVGGGDMPPTGLQAEAKKVHKQQEETAGGRL